MFGKSDPEKIDRIRKELGSAMHEWKENVLEKNREFIEGIEGSIEQVRKTARGNQAAIAQARERAEKAAAELGARLAGLDKSIEELKAACDANSGLLAESERKIAPIGKLLDKLAEDMESDKERFQALDKRVAFIAKRVADMEARLQKAILAMKGAPNQINQARDDVVFGLVASHDGSRFTDIQKAIKTSPTITQNVLRRLIREGRIEKDKSDGLYYPVRG